MDACATKELEDALSALASMIGRSEQAQAKFSPGTPQHTLQQNRIRALRIAAALVCAQLPGNNAAAFTQDELEKAAAPLASLISKSEKAREKLQSGTWQHTMLTNNLSALHMASPLLAQALGEKPKENATHEKSKTG